MKALLVLLVLLAVAGLAGAPERTVPLRVADADPGARFITLVDAAGITRVFPVRGDAARMLPRLRPDDEVVLTLGPEPGISGGPEVVLRIEIRSRPDRRGMER
jgi:hypothetical protein